jgi:hypothetical protein
VPAVFFYISGHGFGHASRQIEVINALGASPSAPEIFIRTSADQWLFERTVRSPFTIIPGPCDTGIVQIDSLRLDARETIRLAAAFHRQLPAHAEAESALLRRHDARLVISDAPPLACSAAARAGIPSVVLANFTWDWIYQAYSDQIACAPDVIPTIESAYATASAGWRLPLSGGFSTVPNVVDLPFIARHARHERSDVRRILDLPRDRPLALSSFGGYGVHGLDPASLDCLDSFGVVLTGRTDAGPTPRGVHFVDERRLYDCGLRYEDLVSAVDVVVTKPGFGIIAECVANGTAILYTSRGRFPEYDVMVRELPRLLRCAYIDHDSLFGGRWRERLNHVLSLPAAPANVPTDGARVAEEMIRELL